METILEPYDWYNYYIKMPNIGGTIMKYTNTSHPITMQSYVQFKPKSLHQLNLYLGENYKEKLTIKFLKEEQS